MKTYLNVPFSEKEAAKARGAKFDMAQKRWFVPDGIDLVAFSRWVDPRVGKWIKGHKRLWKE